MTPAGCASGKGTPFQLRNRSVSAENLASMDGAASSDFGASVLQSRLQIRGLIQDGDLAGVNAFLICVVVALCLIILAIITCCGFCIRRCWKRRRLGGRDTYRMGCHRGRRRRRLLILFLFPNEFLCSPMKVSRRVSEEDEVTSGSITPLHIEYSAEGLANVPNYTTALQSNPRT